MPSPKRAKKKPFKPNLPVELLQPIELPDFVREVDKAKTLVEKVKIFEGRRERENKIFTDAYTKKFQILMDHYRLDRADKDFWEKLAKRVIADYIPGFQRKQKRTAGAKNKWDQISYLCLWHEVTDLLDSGQFPTALAACYHLADRSIWKDMVTPRSKSRSIGDNLYEQYERAQRSPAVNSLKKITVVL